MKYLDFDRMLAEQKQTMVCIQAFGRRHEIADRIPAVLVLELMQYDEGAEIPAVALVRAAARLFGEECVESWMNKDNISLDALGALLRETLQLLSGAPKPEARVSEDSVGARPKN